MEELGLEGNFEKIFLEIGIFLKDQPFLLISSIL